MSQKPVTNADAVAALLARTSRSSRAWRKRGYLYQALDHFEKYGDRHSQVWMLLLWWICEPEVEGYGLHAPPRRPPVPRGVSLDRPQPETSKTPMKKEAP